MEAISWRRTLLLSGLIGLIAGGITVAIFSTEPSAVRGGASKKTAMLVRTVTAKRGTHRPTIVATGTVEASEDILIEPEVGGQVVFRSESFDPGHRVEKGEILLRLEARDYRHTLAQRQSALSQAESELELEMGRQKVAAREVELVAEELTTATRDRALRKPQLMAAKAQVDSAKAGVEQAKLALSRTVIRAPFTGQILRRDVTVGSRATPGTPVGRMIGTETFWVIATLPHRDLRWVSFSRDATRGSKVLVRNRGSWPKGVYREGTLTRPVGALDPETRLVRVIVEVEDPLSEAPEDGAAAPPLMVGEFLEARIEGKRMENVFRLDRAHLRAGDTVWLNEDGKLRIREVEVGAKDEAYVYVTAGLEEGEQIVTSNLATVTEGASLRLAPGTQGQDG